MKKNYDDIKEYYGGVLKSGKDLKTGACCTADSLPDYLKPVLSQLVGEGGKVIGLDMTNEPIELARRHTDWHMQKFGFAKPNVEFVTGYIEDLEEAGLADNSVDLVISNCVINLSPDKPKVFREIFRVLKPGAELYFSDVFTDRRIPAELRNDPVLLGECLAGAMYTEDFRRLMLNTGVADYRVVKSSPVPLLDKEIQQKIGMVSFSSLTIRAFKLDLEDKCEDYGQVAYYKGTIPESPHEFMLDDHHLIKKGMPFLVCGNTAAMLSQSRYAEHFTITGDTSTHFGLFDCGPSPVKNDTATVSGACC